MVLSYMITNVVSVQSDIMERLPLTLVNLVTHLVILVMDHHSFNVHLVMEILSSITHSHVLTHAQIITIKNLPPILVNHVWRIVKSVKKT
jgi:hypothetical protein